MPYSGSWLRAAALAGLTALGVAPTPTMAADMFKFPVESAPEFALKQVELGSGWYLRGGLGASNNSGPVLITDAPEGRKIDWAFDVGAGYKFNNWLRTDATLTFNKPRDVSKAGAVVTCPYRLTGLTRGSDNVLLGYQWDPDLETCNSKFSSDLKKTDLMLNAYIDLGSWGGLTPFVGAGAGVSLLKSSAGLVYSKTSTGEPYIVDLTPTGAFPNIWVSKYTGNAITSWTDATGVVRQGQPPVSFDKQNWNRRATKTSFNLAWSLMGGVAYDITPQLKTEFSYRYMNSGSFTSSSSLLTSPVKSTISSHQMQIGFRYQID